MYKKTITLIVAILFVITVFAGCSSTAQPTATSSQSTVAQTEVSAATAASAQPTVPNVPVPKGGHVKAIDQLPDKPLRIACLAYSNNPYWVGIQAGGEGAKEYLSNYNITVDYKIMGADLKADTCIAAIETAIAEQYDGIVVSPFSDGTEVIINKAVDSGIPVITFSGESSVPSKRLAFSGTDTVKFAQTQAQATIDYLKAKGIQNPKVANITGFFSVAPHELCRKTYQQYLADNAPYIQFLGSWEGKDSGDTTYNVAKDIITANPDVNIIYCNAGGPYGAAKAIQDLGLTGKVGVVCNDWIPDNLKYVKTGEIVVCVDQNPFGISFDAIVSMYNYIVGGIKPPEFIPSENPVLTPDTYVQLIGD